MTQKELKEILDYDPKTGVFTNRVQRGPRGGKGKKAGSLNSRGYINIKIDNKLYKASRLVFLWMTGDWPKKEVDHINRVKDDNRWSNLRDVERSENMHNRLISKELPMGVTEDRGKFRARISKRGRQIFLGHFDSSEEASRAYKRAALKLYGEPVGAHLQAISTGGNLD